MTAGVPGVHSPWVIPYMEMDHLPHDGDDAYIIMIPIDWLHQTNHIANTLLVLLYYLCSCSDRSIAAIYIYI